MYFSFHHEFLGADEMTWHLLYLGARYHPQLVVMGPLVQRNEEEKAVDFL